MPAKIKSVSFTSPYDAEQAEIERRRSLAEMLSKQSMQSLQTNRMAGRMAIPIHPLEGAAQLAQGLSGAYQDRQASEQQKSLYERMQQERSRTLSEALRAGRGTPEVQAGFEYGGQAAQPGDPRAVYERLAQSQDPMLMQLGIQGSLPQI